MTILKEEKKLLKEDIREFPSVSVFSDEFNGKKVDDAQFFPYANNDSCGCHIENGVIRRSIHFLIIGCSKGCNIEVRENLISKIRLDTKKNVVTVELSNKGKVIIEF